MIKSTFKQSDTMLISILVFLQEPSVIWYQDENTNVTSKCLINRLKIINMALLELTWDVFLLKMGAKMQILVSLKIKEKIALFQ